MCYEVMLLFHIKPTNPAVADKLLFFHYDYDLFHYDYFIHFMLILFTAYHQNGLCVQIKRMLVPSSAIRRKVLKEPEDGCGFPPTIKLAAVV